MAITNFGGEYRLLSNFARHEDLPSVLWGYPTMEHYYQAMKTNDRNLRKSFLNPDLTPAQAKRLGRYLDLRPGWDDMKIDVMRVGLERKFTIPDCAFVLLYSEHHELVEGNTWHDNFWGDCTCPSCDDQPGHNHLGILLMQIRDEGA